MGSDHGRGRSTCSVGLRQAPEERAQEGEVCKEGRRNGGDGESDLGFGISTLFIMEAAEGTHNGSRSRARIFGPKEE
jgi:hypothetical protein